MSFKDQLIRYAERELGLIGFMNSPLGKVCLDFLETCAEVTNEDADSMKHVCEILPRLIDLRPLSPITEDDFAVEVPTDTDQDAKVTRSTRYPYLYRTSDGKYYDDRAVVFQEIDSNGNTNTVYLYQEVNSSKQEVELPYFPIQQVKNLD